MVDVGGGTGFCTQGIVKTISPINVVLMDQSPQQLAKAKKKKDLQGVTIVEVQLPSANASAQQRGKASSETYEQVILVNTHLLFLQCGVGRCRGSAFPHRQL